MKKNKQIKIQNLLLKKNNIRRDMDKFKTMVSKMYEIGYF